MNTPPFEQAAFRAPGLTNPDVVFIGDSLTHAWGAAVRRRRTTREGVLKTRLQPQSLANEADRSGRRVKPTQPLDCRMEPRLPGGFFPLGGPISPTLHLELLITFTAPSPFTTDSPAQSPVHTVKYRITQSMSCDTQLEFLNIRLAYLDTAH